MAQCLYPVCVVTERFYLLVRVRRFVEEELAILFCLQVVGISHAPNLLSRYIKHLANLSCSVVMLFNSRESEYVFSVDGGAIKEISRADFANALKVSGIFDFRFHDLRHTWASWHVQNGTPLMTLKELGGWEKLEMVNKYAHLSTEHLSRFSGIVTFLAQDEIGKENRPALSLVNY